MGNIPTISESEWKVMTALWKKSPLSSNEIIEILGLHPQTTRTFLTRLVKKKVISFYRDGRNYMYEPIFTEAMCQAAESRSFLDRVFGGSLTPMLTQLVEEEVLTLEEINELKRILNKQNL